MIRSPIFYMGNKLGLLEKLFLYFPKECNHFVDLFGGSGVVSINVPYQNITYNEINHNIVDIFKMLISKEPEEIIEHIQQRMLQFNLPNEGTDIRQNVKGIEKIRFKAQENYLRFRSFYNESQKNILDLFTLTFFSFSNLIRFNSKDEFNMPFGNRTFTKEHQLDIKIFHNHIKKKNVKIIKKDAIEILKEVKENSNQFIYLDPPYTNTLAIYNEQRAFGGWTIDSDYKLMEQLDRINDLGVKWAMSNVLINKGKENKHLSEWANNKGYEIIDFEEKQYSSLGKGNAKSREVLIVNYETPFKRYSLF